jgi:hypothetical protein
VTAGLLGILTISDGFIYLILQDKGSFAVRWFQMLYVGTNVVLLLFAIPLGKLADRWGRIPVFLDGHLFAGLLRPCRPAVRRPGSHTRVPAPAGNFLPRHGRCPRLAAIVSLLSPAANVAMALGTAQTVFALSRMVAAAGFGVLWFLLGPVTAMIRVVALLAAALVTGTVLMGGVRRWMATA